MKKCKAKKEYQVYYDGKMEAKFSQNVIYDFVEYENDKKEPIKIIIVDNYAVELTDIEFNKYFAKN